MSETDETPIEPRGERLKRHAGCLVGCLTEPLVMVWLLAGSILAGWLWRRKARPATQEGKHD
ncbi:MAG: hypothetical protein KKI08_04755 [Armatimonadetes bacterium]|nr:hypothetical protein [Armatimonadota bacterium]